MILPVLTSLLCWYDATGIETANLSTVFRWKDNVASAHLVQSAAYIPTYAAPAWPLNAPGVQTGPQSAPSWLSAAIAASNTNSFTLYALVSQLADGIGGARTMLGLSAGAELDRFEFPLNAGTITNNLVIPVPSVQATIGTRAGYPFLLCFVGNDGLGNRKLYINGVLAATGATASSAFSNLVLGTTYPVGTTYATPNIFYEVALFGANHSMIDRQTMEAYFVNRYGGYQVVFDGNSQIKGDHCTGSGTTASESCNAQYWAFSTNNGQNGITTPQLTARMASTLALFNTAIRKRVLVFLEIENDLNTNGASVNPSDTSYAPTAWQNIIAYSRAARAGGQKIVACTGLPIGSLIPPAANYENLRQAVNAILLTNGQSIDATTGQLYFERISNIGGPLSAIGTVASTADPQYYDPADRTHLNDGGWTYARNTIVPEITAVL